MCGIVGYIGKNRAAKVLIEGLKKLEYRGYDSVGISVFENDKVVTVKVKGRMADLEKKLKETGIPEGRLGIGHTRWATHGEPSDVNSHPHSCGKVTLVHNGIIENYAQLKARLLDEDLASSEYLSTKQEESQSKALKSALYTGVAYIFTVIFLILPFMLVPGNISFNIFGLNIPSIFLALLITICVVILIILGFTFYISVAKNLNFKKRFWEMITISLGVAVLSFLVGYLVKFFFKIDI